jgi:hypothetical protein
MRRALIALALVAVAASFRAISASGKTSNVAKIDGIGLIDYSARPHWKVGDYVRYHLLGSSAMGSRDDYELTLAIVGEEVFWGDSCFWLETWTDSPGLSPQTSCTLMSYSIFDDSLAGQHMETYRRKFIEGVDEDGNLVEKAYLLSGNTSRKRTMFDKPAMQDVDTLGVDTVRTPIGLLKTKKVSIRLGVGAETSVGDSSSWNEERENRMRWMSPAVPITHIAYEEVEKLVTRKSWLIGRSKEASPTIIRDRGLAAATLVTVGHGLKGRLVPENRQHGFRATARPGGARTAARR